MRSDEDGKAASRAWLRGEQRTGNRAARPVVALGLLGIAMAVAQAWCAASLLAGALIGRPHNTLPLLVGFAALALLRVGIVAANDRTSFNLGAVARRRLRTDTLSRLLHAGPALLRTQHTGELTTTVVERIEALDGLYARWLPASVLAVLGPALVAISALLVSPVATLVLVLCGLLVPMAMALAGIGAAAASRRQFLALARLQARFLDRVRGIATIVLYGQAEAEARSLAVAANELRRRTLRVLRVAFLSSAALDIAAAAAFILLVLWQAEQLLAGQLANPATALFVLLLVPEFFAPLRAFAAAYQDRLHASGAADVLADLPSLPAPGPAREIRTVAARGITVAFENVDFTWDAARSPALNGLSFRVPAGETLVLAGPSGAGKSTVIELLLGFARPDRGRVTINGADITDLVPQALARLTAWIGQRPVLFAGTIRDNIRFARPEATEEEIITAAENARVNEFAAGLPDGLDTIVGEGGYGLSGGQAQRVAIARAFLKNAPLLLLDEPTAHLDPATEAEVLESLRRLALGRTVILASHSSAAHGFAGRRLDIRHGQAMAARGAA
jgi:ATP-binding cassette, subfamily C, bacterial CydD